MRQVRGGGAEGCAPPTTEGSGLLGEAVPKTTKLLMAIILLTMAFFCCAVLAGCAEKTGDKAGDNPSAKERGAGGASATNTGSPADEPTTSGTEVGEAFAEAELRPVGGSGVSGEAVFKEVGSLGVQVELEVSGLPASASEDTEEPEPYFAQVHGGSCSEVPKGRGHEHEEDRHTHDDHPGHARQEGGSDPALALIHLEWFLPGVRAEEFADHAEYEDPPTDELPGNTDLPLVLVASSDGTGMVTSLLEGVEPERLTSGGPKYIDLRAPSHDAPELWPALACADLGEEGS